MQRAGVSPDKKFYAALMAVAGKAGRLDIVLEHLQVGAARARRMHMGAHAQQAAWGVQYC